MSALGARVRSRPGLIALLCCLAVVGTTAWWQVGGDAAAAPSTVVMRDPGSVLKGPLTLFVTTSVPPAQVASIEFQAAPSGTDQWAPIANATGAVLSAPLDTGTLADGLYDLRAVLTDTTGATGTSPLLTDRLIANTSPVVTLADPGANLRRAITLKAAAPEDGSVTAVRFERAAAGTEQWTTIATDTTAPFTATFDTTTTADGPYDFRVIPSNEFGDEFAAVPLRGRRIDNTPPTATLADPGSTLSGRVQLSAAASDGGSGVSTVRFERARSGGGAWSAIGTSTRAPYARRLDTVALDNGRYDFRVTVTDAAGNTGTSDPRGAITIDNGPPDVAQPAAIESFSTPARDVTLLGTIAGSAQHEAWAYGFTSGPPAVVDGAPLPYTATGRQLVLLQYTDDAGWRIADVLRNPDGSPFKLLPAAAVNRAGVSVEGAMADTGEAWIWLSEASDDPAQPPRVGLFHRAPAGAFTFDDAAAQALGANLLRAPGQIEVRQDPGGKTYGLLLAPRQTPRSAAVPAGGAGTVAITEALDYGVLDGTSWTRVAAPLPPAYAPVAGDLVQLKLADLDAPQSGWGALFVNRTRAQTAPLPLLLGRFTAASWSYPTTGLDPLDLTGAVTDPKAFVLPTALKADDGGVWIGATTNLPKLRGAVVARYDEADARVGDSWCSIPGAADACDEPLDPDHPAAVPDAVFGGADGTVALALRRNFIHRYQHGTWTRIPAPGFGGTGRPGVFSALDDAWLPGAEALGHWTTAEAVSPLASWSLTNRSPLTSVALPPGSATPIGVRGPIAVGLDGTTLAYDPTAGWQVSPSPARTRHINLLAAAFAGPSKAFAVGQFGSILRWDGATWTEDPQSIALTQSQLNALAFNAAGEGWAVGTNGTILHFDGQQWSTEQLAPEDAGVTITSVATAGPDVFAIAGGHLVARGSDGIWARVPTESLPKDFRADAADLRLVSGLPDGGAVVAGRSTVLERSGSGDRFTYAGQPLEGIPVALAAFRDPGGQVRAFASVSPPVIDPITLTAHDIGGFPAGDGELLRQTSTGWQDLSRAQYPGAPGDLPGDGAVKPDPVLAVATSPDGAHAWAAGGYAGTVSASGLGSAAILPARPAGWRTAAMWRFDEAGSAASTALAPTQLELPAKPATVSFAFFSSSMCRVQCADALDAQPDVNLTAATRQIAAYADQPGGPAFAMLGGNARGPVDTTAYQAGNGAFDFSRLRDLLAPLDGVPLFAAFGPKDAVPGLSDPQQPWADALADSPAPFGAGAAAPGITPVSSGAATGTVHRYYAFDAAQNGGTLRVIVLDNSQGSLEAGAPGQTAWLQDQLASAQAAGLPVVAVAALPLRGAGIQAGTASDGADVAGMLAGAGALAVFTTNGPGQLDEQYQVPENVPDGTPQIPEYEGASLGYQQTGNNGVMWYFASIDTAARKVDVQAVPIVDSLSIKPLDGLTTSRSNTLQFEAVGRRPPGTIATRPDESFQGFDSYVAIPAASCGTRPCVQPSYRFTSSDPTIGDFVAPSGTGSKYPKLDSKGKTTASAASGLFCSFNAGTTTVSVTTGLLTYSLPVTVRDGGFGRPCGTVFRQGVQRVIVRSQPTPAGNGSAAVPPPAPAPSPALAASPPLLAPPPPPPAHQPTPPTPAPTPVLAAPEPFFAPTDGGGFASRVAAPPTPPPAQPVPPPPGGAQAPSTAKREEKARKHASQSAYTIRPAGTSGSEWFLGGTAVATVLTLLLVGAGVRPGPRRGPALARVSVGGPARAPRSRRR